MSAANAAASSAVKRGRPARIAGSSASRRIRGGGPVSSLACLGRFKLKPRAGAERDTESVPLADDVDEFFAREVAPHVPDAWVDRTKTDHKDGQVGVVRSSRRWRAGSTNP
jgi:hypothetical protein